MSGSALQVVNLVLLAALVVAGAVVVHRVRRRSREIQARLEELGHGLARLEAAHGRLEAALGAEERERARQDSELEARSCARLEAAVGPVTERLAELGRVQREAARVARAVAEGQLAPGVAVRLEGHLAELAADLATDKGPEP